MALKFVIGMLLIFTSACGMNMGDRVDASNLSVYYLEGVSKDETIRFAKYWRQNGFVGEAFQTIQLEKDRAGWVLVKIIENEEFHQEDLSIQESALINELERSLSDEVFLNQRVEIIITDNTFRPLKRN